MSGHTTLQRNRVWELDAIRGYLILWVLLYHLYFTVEAFCINGIYHIDPHQYVNATDPFRIWFAIEESGRISLGLLPQFAQKYFQPAWVDIFFIVSGVSCIFSRDNLKSGLRLLAGAAIVSLFTWILTLTTGDKGQFIRFGVLHCYALCHLIYYFLLEGRKDSVLLVTAALSLVIGYFLEYHPIQSNYALLVPFGIREYGAIHRDYWPVFPMLGWFLIGVVLGRRFYSEKKTRFPKLENMKWHRPLCFLGRYSGLIYCGHMVVYTLVFSGIGYIFDLY